MNQIIADSVLAPPIPAWKAKCRSTAPIHGKVFDLSQAVPNFPTFEKIRQSLTRMLGEEATSYYTDVPGILPLRTKIVETHPILKNRHPDQVLITAGANHAMYTALLTLVERGDTVMLLEPYYFNYDMVMPMLGLTPYYFPLSDANGLSLRASEVIRGLEANSAVKALILITPNNPSGACYAASEILELLRWTAPRGIEVIVDETYLKFDPHHLNETELGSFLGEGLSLVGSFSKSYSLTGYRVGYFVTGGRQMREALKIQDTLVICAPHISQLAALCGMNECEHEVQREVARMAHLSTELASRAESLKHFRLVNCGAFFAYLKHPFSSLKAEPAAMELYLNTGIMGLPGTVFGKSQDNYIRLSISNLTASDLTEAIESLISYDRSLGRGVSG